MTSTIPISELLARYQDMHWCEICDAVKTFLPFGECEFGRVGYCLGCGEEKIVGFTRATGEAA